MQARAALTNADACKHWHLAARASMRFLALFVRGGLYPGLFASALRLGRCSQPAVIDLQVEIAVCHIVHPRMVVERLREGNTEDQHHHNDADPYHVRNVHKPVQQQLRTEEEQHESDAVLQQVVPFEHVSCNEEQLRHSKSCGHRGGEAYIRIGDFFNFGQCHVNLHDKVNDKQASYRWEQKCEPCFSLLPVEHDAAVIPVAG
mmetsp:Transcript_44251/g.102198  ORF Transcript_44251/g.102198 Transcript_44251/m.102198 type:complete len:203 (-) Transcript_44251:454-1062(-)